MINAPAVPWSGCGSRYTDDEIAFIVEAMRTADPMTQGRYQDRFEAEFRALTGARHAFAVSSCTAALELAAIVSRIGPGDEVILPAHTFAATAIPFGRTGARLVWADIEPDTFVVSARTIEPLITEHTKVIIVVHLYGLMADMDPIMELARERSILVVEDAAQAIGATYKGRQAGSLGDLGCFSFHTHKNLTTLGEGGMLTVADPELAKLVPGLRHNGVRGFEGERAKYWQPAMSNINFDLDGVWPYNFCIGEVQCAAGIVQLARLEAMNGNRAERARRMTAALGGRSDIAFQRIPDECRHVHYCMPARITGGPAARDAFMERMAFHHKVRMVVQYYPLYRYPMFQKAGFGDAQCPETDRFFDSMVSFPFHEWMPEDQFGYMVEATGETLDHIGTRQRTSSP
ncbi:aminotransferase [Magnetospirillum sp. ME-1]|uniref:DegT/DnrJ/EryC1/StrS family aminotransferase n=1 Tax=Magnetospirillum sp. ME-1 TaxID=1639348 RepID=UPI000A17D1E1|nr:DegT/DnrJ/EryC1/StrS family aminotransferase [Magnetospirillum sp. ME-1]ARJ66552.1 aminotransferase [Magnetospirillum sp. ME-1]